MIYNSEPQLQLGLALSPSFSSWRMSGTCHGYIRVLDDSTLRGGGEHWVSALPTHSRLTTDEAWTLHFNIMNHFNTYR